MSYNIAPGREAGKACIEISEINLEIDEVYLTAGYDMVKHTNMTRHHGGAVGGGGDGRMRWK